MKDIELDLILETRDYFLTGEKFGLYRNPEYGFLETRPVPLNNLPDYYKSDEYISHSDSKKSWFDKIYQLIKKYNISYKFSKLKVESGNKSLLDYGCGTGDFLKYAKNKGLTVLGIEPNQNALKLAQQKIGNDLVKNTELKNLNQQFDYITLWHVLEHIPNLEELIIELKNKLKADGKIIIAVPNHDSFDSKYYKSFWAAWDVPRHLWHFSNDSFQNLSYKFGLEVVNKYPLWFDSFYISFISEKYKKSKFRILRAPIIGFISNLYGMKNKNYSSVIYILKKNEY